MAFLRSNASNDQTPKPSSAPNSSYRYLILACELYNRKIIAKKQLLQKEILALKGSTDIQSIRLSAAEHANELVLGQLEMVHLDNLDKLADIKLGLLKYTMETDPEELGGKETEATRFLEELEDKYEEINTIYEALVEKDKDIGYKINGHVKNVVSEYKQLIDETSEVLITNLKNKGFDISTKFERLLKRGLKKRKLSFEDLNYSEGIRKLKLAENDTVKWAVAVATEESL